MKFQIDSVQACNHAWRVEDRFEEMLKLYPYLKDKITELPDNNKYELYVQRCKRCGTIKSTKIWY